MVFQKLTDDQRFTLGQYGDYFDKPIIAQIRCCMMRGASYDHLVTPSGDTAVDTTIDTTIEKDDTPKPKPKRVYKKKLIVETNQPIIEDIEDIKNPKPRTKKASKSKKEIIENDEIRIDDTLTII